MSFFDTPRLPLPEDGYYTEAVRVRSKDGERAKSEAIRAVRVSSGAVEQMIEGFIDRDPVALSPAQAGSVRATWFAFLEEFERVVGMLAEERDELKDMDDRLFRANAEVVRLREQCDKNELDVGRVKSIILRLEDEVRELKVKSKVLPAARTEAQV